jgi:hypothetical protein
MKSCSEAHAKAQGTQENNPVFPLRAARLRVKAFFLSFKYL